MKLRYQNLMSVSQSGKSVPYGGAGEQRPDGDANHGFRNLKGHPDDFRTVPELQRDPALLGVVAAINHPSTAFFSIGCTSSDVIEDHNYRRTGYVEFAFNSASLAADASSYFPLYFHFDRYLASIESTMQVAYQWELMGADFSDSNVCGFTCSIFINTFFVPSHDEAMSSWSEALKYVETYLGGIPTRNVDYIYAADA